MGLRLSVVADAARWRRHLGRARLRWTTADRDSVARHGRRRQRLEYFRRAGGEHLQSVDRGARFAVLIASAIAPLVSSVWIDRHRRTTSRRDGPIVDPLPADAVGSVDEFSTWRAPALHDHHDPSVEPSLGLIDVG